jgi:hypothetical protein
MEGQQSRLAKSQSQEPGPRCTACAAFSRLTTAMLDTSSGKIIHLYKCDQCGERVWDDNRNFRAYPTLPVTRSGVAAFTQSLFAASGVPEVLALAM